MTHTKVKPAYSFIYMSWMSITFLIKTLLSLSYRRHAAFEIAPSMSDIFVFSRRLSHYFLFSSSALAPAAAASLQRESGYTEVGPFLAT